VGGGSATGAQVEQILLVHVRKMSAASNNYVKMLCRYATRFFVFEITKIDSVNGSWLKSVSSAIKPKGLLTIVNLPYMV